MAGMILLNKALFTASVPVWSFTTMMVLIGCVSCREGPFGGGRISRPGAMDRASKHRKRVLLAGTLIGGKWKIRDQGTVLVRSSVGSLAEAPWRESMDRRSDKEVKGRKVGEGPVDNDGGVWRTPTSPLIHYYYPRPNHGTN